MQWQYLYCGLKFSSAVEISAWAFCEQKTPFLEPDVQIHLENHIRAPIILPEEPDITPQQFFFRIENLGSYVVQYGNEIFLYPNPGSDMNEVHLFTTGWCFAAICYQRGLYVIHTSIIKITGGIAAFVGPVKAGKSSLAAHLLDQGGQLIADDLTRVELPSPEAVLVYPTEPRLKLWQETIDQLDWHSYPRDRDLYRLDKYHLPWQGLISLAPVNLDAIYILEWGDTNSIQRVRGKEGLKSFAAAAFYRENLLKPVGFLGAYWQFCMQMVRRVPVYKLTRTKDWDEMPRVIHKLRTHIAERQP